MRLRKELRKRFIFFETEIEIEWIRGPAWAILDTRKCIILKQRFMFKDEAEDYVHRKYNAEEGEDL